MEKKASSLFFLTNVEGTTKNTVCLARKSIIYSLFPARMLVGFLHFNLNIFTVAMSWSSEINVINLAM